MKDKAKAAGIIVGALAFWLAIAWIFARLWVLSCPASIVAVYWNCPAP